MSRLRSIVVAAAVWATACVGCGGDTKRPITIGVLANCGALFSVFHEPTLAAAELPLIDLGGRPLGAKPSGGVSGAEVGGHPVRLVLGCADGTATAALRQARRLVEHDGADVLVGGFVDNEGLALRFYAHRRPETTFVNGASSDQALTLIDPATNLFRFNPDAAQLMAGLGDYAYRRLGWRRVAVVADRNPFGYAQAAGFVAEFCSLGGTVTTRIFPYADGSDLRSAVGKLPAGGQDGVLVTTAFISVPFLRAYVPSGRLSNRVLLGGTQTLGSIIQAFGGRATGLVAAAALPPDGATPQSRRYERRLRLAFPSLSLVEPRFDVYYYNAMTAVLGALATVKGDLSDRQERFRAALAQTELDAPNGFIRLDRNRQAVLPNYIVQLQRGVSGGLIPRTIRTIPRVDESFGGLFRLNGSPASAVSPRCVAGDPPPWARSP